ncbi:hypothetical protein B0H17DRAFT_1044973 [Mycena rosella]|uniref:Uncharacterized protein n=1 Tax=Mycena rosella TaxID=1033263 RepID=A0AAD7GMN8_MYCRO|nr:hypothetical protein B0H17DRAFT_1044973 [Mycena rosella]
MQPACREVPQSPVPEIAYEGVGKAPRWANSGTVIGTVKSMKEVYGDLVAQMPETTSVGDQGIFNEFLHQGRITLDYWSRLFWANAHNVNSGTVVNTRYPVSAFKDDTVPYHLLPPMLYFSRTGEYPVAIHFNDRPHKSLLEKWWGNLWWTKPGFKLVWEKRLETGTMQFAHNGSTVRWGDLCGDMPI